MTPRMGSKKQKQNKNKPVFIILNGPLPIFFLVLVFVCLFVGGGGGEQGQEIFSRQMPLLVPPLQTAYREAWKQVCLILKNVIFLISAIKNSTGVP